MQRLNILVVEDDALIADDLKGYLIEFGHHVVGPAASVAAAQRLVIQHAPDAAILDINLGEPIEKGDHGGEGCRLAEWINTEHPMPFIYLTGHSDEGTLARAKSTHPGGYILKPFSGAEIRVALEVALGNFQLRTQERGPLLDHGALTHVLANPLSVQEMRVLSCVADGSTNREIAEHLFISENTVKTHLKHIFEKLNVRNRTEAIHKARSLSSP